MREAFGASFDITAGYLNTASIGVPPVTTARAVADSVAAWSRAEQRASDFDESVATARAAFARLIGVAPERVACGATVSQLVGSVAASIPDGASVLVAEHEFTSVTWPFAAHRDRGVQLAEVDLARIPELAAEHDAVAVSVVQSRDGRMVDLAGLRRAAREHGTRVLLDVTQAAGWLPLELDWADWVVGAGYKWLLAPRGAAWLALRDPAELRPLWANWYAGEQPWDSIYGVPPRMAGDARALDLSPVWLAQAGAAVSLRMLAGLDMAAVAEHCLGLARRLCAGLEVAPSDSPIVSVPAPADTRGSVADELAAAGVRCAVRGERPRLAFHLYNTAEDVDLALEVLRRAGFGRT